MFFSSFFHLLPIDKEIKKGGARMIINVYKDNKDIPSKEQLTKIWLTIINKAEKNVQK